MIDRTWRPQFLVIGAVKAATTWIQARLQENPAIFMPAPEPHYFSSEFERGEEWYRTFFAERPAAAHVIGEKSADYLAHPLAARRIASRLPDVKLVLQLRNPVDRAYSDYKMFYRRGTVKGPPEEYLSSPDNPFPRFLEDGLYARHLARWFDLFPREQMLAYLYEDVVAQPRQIITAVSRHIGTKPCFEPGHAATHDNSSRTAILPLPLRRALAPLKDSMRPLRGNPVFEGVRSLIAREVAYPPLTPALRERLRDFYARDVETLEAMFGLDLARWKAPTRHVPVS
ncbi:sulfotransferase domain-containing protein [Novosphingobium sp. PhB165]|uniref:sulfotransferase n=1 Tax=Novosphingobium sp. PhB165 TaxID=2485105 RepID=UPI0010509550|nr:sulfotransferase domain-containing protein [Novosphingobium sp. PhB165]TCM21373.1 sulfotransferase domain-containing protein [Novosphingobium sp. PhB165]